MKMLDERSIFDGLVFLVIWIVLEVVKSELVGFIVNII